MANYRAIAAVTRGIAALLRSARPPAEFPNTEIKIFHQRDFQRGLEEGISIYLYRTTVSGSRRNWPNPPLTAGQVRLPAIPVDLYYLLTPWARSVEMQHVLLGWCIRTIEDAPTIPSGLLNGEIPETFGEDENIQLILDTVSLADMVNIWEVNKANIQVSVGYVARVVPLDSTIAFDPSGPPVQTRVFDAGQPEEP